MQKLFSNCYALDSRCYEQFGLSEDLLMENAAMGISNYVKKYFANKSVFIACGPGNNGADGITVARQLCGICNVYLYLPLGAKSQMAKLQLQRAQNAGVEIVQEVIACEVTIDALFGAGLNKKLPQQIEKILEQLNQLSTHKIACDIPTGVLENGSVLNTVFKADITFTMGALKTSLFSDLALDYRGEIEVIDLGISRQNYEMQTDMFLLQEKDFKPPFREKKFSHKGNFGHLNVLVGQKRGAGILCAKAATRFGAGLVTLITNEKIDSFEELMVDSHVSHNCSGLCVGMGLGNEFTDDFLQKEIVQKDLPVVLDADGFSNTQLLKILKQKRDIVLTPHPKEFVKLLTLIDIEISTQELLKDKMFYLQKFANAYPDAVIVLKGANTFVAAQEKIYINPFYSANLSQGGSGDILSGLIGALLAQGYSPADAALQGSLALSFAARNYTGSNFSMTPNDLIQQLKNL